jgi:hypothetical protein
MYYDRDGKEIELMDWATRPRKYRRVLGDHVIGYWISTIWLGLDHTFGRDKLIFETMIWAPDDSILNYQERYSTEVAARLGHCDAITWVRERFSLERHRARWAPRIVKRTYMERLGYGLSTLSPNS